MKKQLKNIKNTKPTINLDDFSKDADFLFKKYNLKTGIIVADYSEGAENFVLNCVNSPDEKEEAALLLATQELFSIVSLNSDNLFVIINILKELRDKAIGVNPKEDVKLTKKEENLVKKIREIKNKLVREQNYEEALPFRIIEKQILNGEDYSELDIKKLIKKSQK